MLTKEMKYFLHAKNSKTLAGDTKDNNNKIMHSVHELENLTLL